MEIKFKKYLKIALLGIGLAAALSIGLYFLLYRDIPYYKDIRNFKMLKFTASNITVAADVICYNPNNIAVTLSDCRFDVFANGKHVSEIKQNYGTPVPAASEFKVPLRASFSPKKIFKPKDLIGPALLTLAKKKIDLRYDGVITVTAAGADIDIEVEVEDWVSLKK